jgi:hypothetical protein
MPSQQKNMDRLAVQHVYYVRSVDQMLGNAALGESCSYHFSFIKILIISVSVTSLITVKLSSAYLPHHDDMKVSVHKIIISNDRAT